VFDQIFQGRTTFNFDKYRHEAVDAQYGKR
jgi:hypothetical protein